MVEQRVADDVRRIVDDPVGGLRQMSAAELTMRAVAPPVMISTSC